MLGGLWRKFVSMTITVRKLHKTERRIVQDAVELLEAQLYRGVDAQNSLKRDDWLATENLLENTGSRHLTSVLVELDSNHRRRLQQQPAAFFFFSLTRALS